MRENVVDVLYKGLTITNTLLAWARKKVTRRDLAEKTGLAPKQVSRYLNTLDALHFPLTRERRGTEELVTFKRDTSHPVRLLPFTTEELAAVAFYTSLSPTVQDTPLGGLHTACQKIADFLQADLASRPQLREAFLAFAKHAKVYSTPQVESVLHELLPALLESRVCTITYRTPTAAHARRYAIHPYTLCLYQGGLYLCAYRPEPDVLMVLSVERIVAIRVEETRTFTKEPAILQRIEARRQRAFGIIDDGEAYAVTLKFTPEQAPYVRERVWHPSQQIETCSDGTLLLRFEASGAFEIERWILGWGCQVEVLEPPALRDAIAERLRTAARQYGAQQGGPSVARPEGK